MFEETRRHRSPTGADLAYHHAAAEGSARGIVLVLHGLAEHSLRYARFAAALSGRGYHVYAHDHRGHGETMAADAPRGQFSRRNGRAKAIDDVVAVRDLALAAHPGLPVILFGHSMGGLISLNSAITHPQAFDAVAVWNSNFRPGIAGHVAEIILKTERMLKGSDVPSALLPRLTFGAWGQSIPGHRTPFDWLSRDPAAVDAYIADPLCGFDACVSLWLDLFAMSFDAPRPASLKRLRRDLPIHLFGGTGDPATDHGKAVAWLANHLKAEGFSHMSCEIHQDTRHETLNDIGATGATAAFADWCDSINARA
jgi:alpha-beta hydrolase superfamily lysophospholipase